MKQVGIEDYYLLNIVYHQIARTDQRYPLVSRSKQNSPQIMPLKFSFVYLSFVISKKPSNPVKYIYEMSFTNPSSIDRVSEFVKIVRKCFYILGFYC